MFNKPWVYVICMGVGLLLLASTTFPTSAAPPNTTPPLTPIEQLGKLIFFDTTLSEPSGQACADCHAPEVGFTGPLIEINSNGSVYEGANPGLFGNRKPPSAAYAGYSPALHYDEAEDVWIGGLFWDGRATGWELGSPLAEQAQGPFLNALEQSLPHAVGVCNRIEEGDYAEFFEEVFGSDSLDCGHHVAHTYELIARAIAAYETSPEVNPFSSKYDYYLAGMVELSAEEMLGLELFNGKALCAECHPSELGPNGEAPLFTDFTYDNLGVPANPANPFYAMPSEHNPAGADWVDEGLGGFLRKVGYPAEVYEPLLGAQRVPILRNVGLRPSEDFVKAYTHNGYFKSLEDVVHFYNMRDVSDEWPDAEIAGTVNMEELGDLGLTAEEEAALVAFMETLSDGYELP